MRPTVKYVTHYTILRIREKSKNIFDYLFKLYAHKISITLHCSIKNSSYTVTNPQQNVVSCFETGAPVKSQMYEYKMCGWTCNIQYNINKHINVILQLSACLKFCEMINI